MPLHVLNSASEERRHNPTRQYWDTSSTCCNPNPGHFASSHSGTVPCPGPTRAVRMPSKVTSCEPRHEPPPENCSNSFTPFLSFGTLISRRFLLFLSPPHHCSFCLWTSKRLGLRGFSAALCLGVWEIQSKVSSSDCGELKRLALLDPLDHINPRPPRTLCTLCSPSVLYNLQNSIAWTGYPNGNHGDNCWQQDCTQQRRRKAGHQRFAPVHVQHVPSCLPQ